MLVLRKLIAVKVDNITTFGALCKHLLKLVESYGKNSNETHLIMENYKKMSIKSAERRRRAGNKDPGPFCNVVSEQQPLPDMEVFCTNLDSNSSIMVTISKSAFFDI